MYAPAQDLYLLGSHERITELFQPCPAPPTPFEVCCVAPLWTAATPASAARSVFDATSNPPPRPREGFCHGGFAIKHLVFVAKMLVLTNQNWAVPCCTSKNRGQTKQ